MKQLSFLAIALLLAACNPQADSNEIPEDLADQRSMLKEKRAELAELTKVINELEDRIEEADPSARPKAVVTTEKVKVGDFSTYVKIQGNVEADDLFDATAEVGGRILSLNADEGDFVRRVDHKRHPAKEGGTAKFYCEIVDRDHLGRLLEARCEKRENGGIVRWMKCPSFLSFPPYPLLLKLFQHFTAPVFFPYQTE